MVSPKEAKVADTPKESAPDDSDADEAGGPTVATVATVGVFLYFFILKAIICHYVGVIVLKGLPIQHSHHSHQGCYLSGRPRS